MVRALTAAVHQEEGWYITRCLELDVASQGESLEQALANLREAVEALASAGFVHTRTKGSHEVFRNAQHR
jgi:hypothetical protein